MGTDTPAVRLALPPESAPAPTAEEPRTTEAGGRKARAAAVLAAAGEPLLLTAGQASRLYGASAATWYRWVSAGRVPAPVRIGATVRWRREELEAHISAGCPPRREWEARRAAGNANGRH
ncbi:MAG TPA: helix-turn-helix domain-containing protein [Gemmataceae bacterium]|nr:helix-turn-helix domain-containing protein [Gemmataceae bacterium]